MMKTLPTARTIRTTIISVAAVAAMALPLFASAAANNTADGAVGIEYNKANLISPASHEELYARLQQASRNICGSSNIIATGSLRRSVGNTECYNGTLTAAVERLGNAEVTALHNR